MATKRKAKGNYVTAAILSLCTVQNYRSNKCHTFILNLLLTLLQIPTVTVASVATAL